MGIGCVYPNRGVRDPQSVTIAIGASVQLTDGPGTGVFRGSPQQVAAGIRRYQEVGVQDFRFDFPGVSPDGLLQAMEQFAAKVRPQVV